MHWECCMQKKWFLCKIYIYMHVCVCVCTEAILFVLGWGEGRFCTSHITEADGTADLWGRAQQELELLPEDGDYPPPDLSSLREFLLAIDHLEMDVVRHAFAYLYTKYTNCIWVNIQMTCRCVCVLRYTLYVRVAFSNSKVSTQLRCRFGWSVGVHWFPADAQETDEPCYKPCRLHGFTFLESGKGHNLILWTHFGSFIS